MDPNAAYDEMSAAWHAGNYATAWERADGLLRWAASGGFPPDEPRDLFFARAIHEAYGPAGS